MLKSDKTKSGCCTIPREYAAPFWAWKKIIEMNDCPLFGILVSRQ